MAQTGVPHEGASGSLSQETTLTIPVIAEELEVERTRLAVASVRITKTVVEREERVEVTNTDSRVLVDRVAVNQVFDSPPSVRHESGVTIYPVVEEVLVVVTKYLLKEEVRVWLQEIPKPRVESIVLRRENVDIDRSELISNAPSETSSQILEPFSEGTMEWIETADQAIVSKRARVVEEVVLHKEIREHTQTVRQSLRKTELVTEDIGPESR